MDGDERMEREGGMGGRGMAYGEIHHAWLGGLFNVLALGDFGVGVELEEGGGC